MYINLRGRKEGKKAKSVCWAFMRDGFIWCLYNLSSVFILGKAIIILFTGQDLEHCGDRLFGLNFRCSLYYTYTTDFGSISFVMSSGQFSGIVPMGCFICIYQHRAR